MTKLYFNHTYISVTRSDTSITKGERAAEFRHPCAGILKIRAGTAAAQFEAKMSIAAQYSETIHYLNST